jgi:hypothetical protein
LSLINDCDELKKPPADNHLRMGSIAWRKLCHDLIANVSLKR